MTPELALDVIRNALQSTGLIAAPILLGAFVTGVFISIFQAATQIQEPTMTFGPKAIIVGLTLGLGGSWILSQAVNLIRTTFQMISQLGG